MIPPLLELEKLSSVEPDRFGTRAFIIKFRFEEKVVVTIRVLFHDEESGAQLVITNMTTLPFEAARKGFGSRALHTLIKWAQTVGLEDIQATQVQPASEEFWKKNDFEEIGNVTRDFIYVGP